jgi:hypothetical protein
MVLDINEAGHLAGFALPARAAEPMNLTSCILTKIKLNHQPNIRKIDAPAGQVRCNKRDRFSRSEIIKTFDPRLRPQRRVENRVRDSTFIEPFRNLVNCTPILAKNDNLVRITIIDNFF